MEFKDITEANEFANAQQRTMQLQSKKITELERKLESLTIELDQAKQQATVVSALSIDQNENTDAETACVVQIAMIKSLAMSRELTLEETKKLEIFTKTLLLIKGKSNTEDKKKDGSSKLTTEQLLALAGTLTEQ